MTKDYLLDRSLSFHAQMQLILWNMDHILGTVLSVGCKVLSKQKYQRKGGW